MNSEERDGLYSPLSVTKDLWPWCLWVICVLTVAWTAFIAWSEASSGNHPGVVETSIAVGTKAGAGVPLIFIYSVIIVSIGSFIKGGGIMVMARAVESYLRDKIERQRERLREEGREQGIELGLEKGLEQGLERGRVQGREQGIELGREEGRQELEALAAEVADWNRRRLEAEERGEPFDEPPPGVSTHR